MSPPAQEAPPVRAQRPVIVDIVRAYEGILLGLVILLLAAILSGAGPGIPEFTAVLVLPALLMVGFMHLGAPPRGPFLVRTAGALVGWALSWVVFIPLFVSLSYAVFSAAAGILVYITIAVLDGVLIGLCILGVDRLARRLRPPGLARG